MSGFSDIGAALAGIGQDETANPNYQTGMLRGAQASDILEQARERRNKNLASAALTPELVQRAQAGDPEAQAQLITISTQGGYNPHEITGAQTDQQTMGFRGSAMTQAMSPTSDPNLLNRELAVISGKPMTLSAVQGNTLINPNATPGAQAAQGGNVATDVGQSDIAAALARANASNAAAGHSEALTAGANIVLEPDANGALHKINKVTLANAPVMLPDGSAMTQAIKEGGGKDGPGSVPPSMYEAVLGKPLASGDPNPNQLAFQRFTQLHPENTDKVNLRLFASALQNKPTGNFNDPTRQPDVATYTPGGVQLPVSPMAAALNAASTAPAVPGAVSVSGDYTKPGKTVVRTGSANGRKVVQYSDGTIDYAD